VSAQEKTYRRNSIVNGCVLPVSRRYGLLIGVSGFEVPAPTKGFIFSYTFSRT